jgi:hypothetical protein
MNGAQHSMTESVPETFRIVIRAVLDLALERDQPSLPHLTRVLDDLVTLVHRVPAGDVDADFPDPPHGDYQALYRRIGARFPTLGYYATVYSSKLPGEALVGDAIDDLADLVLDLSDVAWLWDKAWPDAACWYFHLHYRAHWGRHLHQLRLHLHDVLVNT